MIQYSDIHALLNKLNHEHEPHYWYRGQSREYPGPLLPSGYRRHILSEKPIKMGASPLSSSMRGIGRLFYRVNVISNFRDAFHRYTFGKSPICEEELFILQQVCHDENVAQVIAEKGVYEGLKFSIRSDVFEKYRKRIPYWCEVIEGSHRALVMVNGLTQYLGFHVGQTISQHYVENSEYLDVSSSPEVASLFASWGAINDDGIGIIYRFSTSKWPNPQESNFDYYNAPPLVNARSVLDCLETTSSSSEEWKPEDFTIFQVLSGGERHWDLLKLKTGSVDSTRIGKQQAGFLVPDELRQETRDKIGQQHITFQAIEDLSARPGVERFYFKHKTDSFKQLPMQPADLWPSWSKSEQSIIELVKTIITARSTLRRCAKERGKQLVEVPDPEMWFPERIDLIRTKVPT